MTDESTLNAWLTLSLTVGVGPIIAQRLVETAGGSAAAACGFSPDQLRNIEGIGTSGARTISASIRKAQRQVDAEKRRAADGGASIICFDDADYPPLLRSIPDPPLVLYVRGGFEPRDLHAVAIVGSRKCSFYGGEPAERFGALLAGAGVTVTSGGARGIDSSAHRGALQPEMGRTIAVLGSGVDVPYPSENAPLLDEIAKRGAVVSEYTMGTPPLAQQFPRRNRIVSGMSRGVLVVEADERSGALITARLAGEEHGRAILALPGRVDSRQSIGPHKLIRDGATLVTCLDDILEALGPLPSDLVDAMPAISSDNANAKELAEAPSAEPQPFQPASSTMSENECAILAALSNDPIDVDVIIERTSLEASAVLQSLTMMSLKGLARRIDGRYVRGKDGR